MDIEAGTPPDPPATLARRFFVSASAWVGPLVALLLCAWARVLAFWGWLTLQVRRLGVWLYTSVRERCDVVKVVWLAIMLFFGILFLTGSNSKSFISAGRMGMPLSILILLIVTAIGSVSMSLVFTADWFVWVTGLLLQKNPFTLALEALVGIVSGIEMSIYGDSSNVYIAVGLFFLALAWLALLRLARIRFDLGIFASLLVSMTSRVLMFEKTKPQALTGFAVFFSCVAVFGLLFWS